MNDLCIFNYCVTGQFFWVGKVKILNVTFRKNKNKRKEIGFFSF